VEFDDAATIDQPEQSEMIDAPERTLTIAAKKIKQLASQTTLPRAAHPRSRNRQRIKPAATEITR
jgi:hypothetical protein